MIDAGSNLLASAAGIVPGTAQFLITAPWPLMVALFGLPPALAALSRSRLHTFAAAIMSLLSLVLMAQASTGNQDYSLAMIAYCGAVLVALGSYLEAQRARDTLSQRQEQDRLREEIRAFLNALDQRTLVIDRLAANDSSPPAQNAGHGQPETRTSA
ncbi:DUF494 domain-containing protein [Microvirga roseola]|uniref:DUF494 domain-containing protein n=1 Tax=Microvirga roseola TaxID=2883126 RepID=UPI001E3D27F3|nr:DUF494 domain-containing protein [Microvirga roseola]